MDPISIISGALVGAGLYFLAYRRKGNVESTRLGSHTAEIESAGARGDVFDVVAAIGAPYAVDDKDREKGVLVLSSRPSIWSYGFLYPVVIRARADGGSVITVGVCSRLIHFGPGMGRAHSLCVKAIQQLLTVPTARLT